MKDKEERIAGAILNNYGGILHRSARNNTSLHMYIWEPSA